MDHEAFLARAGLHWEYFSQGLQVEHEHDADMAELITAEGVMFLRMRRHQLNSRGPWEWLSESSDVLTPASVVRINPVTWLREIDLGAVSDLETDQLRSAS